MKPILNAFLKTIVFIFFTGVSMAQESIKTDNLYIELKTDVQTLVEPLFNIIIKIVMKQGQFLPVGAILNNEKKVEMVAATDSSWEKRKVSATEVLPLLHEVLKKSIESGNGIATGVAEDVTISPEGQGPSKAIKLLFEHKRGLTIAVYLPYQRSLFGKFKTGEMIIQSAKPEVCAWKN